MVEVKAGMVQEEEEEVMDLGEETGTGTPEGGSTMAVDRFAVVTEEVGTMVEVIAAVVATLTSGTAMGVDRMETINDTRTRTAGSSRVNKA